MNFLILTIIVSAIIYVIFKLFSQFKVDTFQAIVVNYFTCALMGIFATGFGKFSSFLVDVKPAIPYAIILGLLFITVFSLIGFTTQTFGIGVASIADKLSLILPVGFAFFAYNDSVTVLKVLGIILSIVAVGLTVLKKSDKAKHKYWYVPLLVFLGAGFISILLKEVQFKFENINYNTFLIFLFGMAFIGGLVYLIYQFAIGKKKLSRKSIIAGVLLGIPNYFSMYFLLQTLNAPNWESSVVFPVLNIGVVILSSLLGILIFKEQLNRYNKIGLVLSIIAISLLLMENLHLV